MVSFRAETDMVFAKHLKCADKYATTISKTVQNYLLEVLEDYVLKLMKSRIAATGSSWELSFGEY